MVAACSTSGVIMAGPIYKKPIGPSIFPKLLVYLLLYSIRLVPFAEIVGQTLRSVVIGKACERL